MSVPANMVTCKTVMGWIMSWIAKQKELIRQLILQKGGWEGWAQAELAVFLSTLPGEPAVQREQPIYNTSKSAVDILITKSNNSICMELKCEGLFKSSDQGHQTVPHSFYQEVQADVFKLSTDRKAAYSDQTAMAVALCFSDEASQPLKKIMDQEEIMDLESGWKLHVFWKVVVS